MNIATTVSGIVIICITHFISVMAFELKEDSRLNMISKFSFSTLVRTLLFYVIPVCLGAFLIVLGASGFSIWKHLVGQ